MVVRIITHTHKDEDGDILKIKGSEYEHFCETIAVAIQQIENNDHNYFVYLAQTILGEPKLIDVEVGHRNGRKYLKTANDTTTRNNLDKLPSM